MIPGPYARFNTAAVRTESLSAWMYDRGAVQFSGVGGCGEGEGTGAGLGLDTGAGEGLAGGAGEGLAGGAGEGLAGGAGEGLAGGAGEGLAGGAGEGLASGAGDGLDSGAGEGLARGAGEGLGVGLGSSLCPMQSQFCSWQTLARGDKLAVLGMHVPLIAALDTNAWHSWLTNGPQLVMAD